MIDVMRSERIEIDEIDKTLDNIIGRLDERRVKVTTNVYEIRKEGYNAGFTDGQFVGYSDGWNAAERKYCGD